MKAHAWAAAVAAAESDDEIAEAATGISDLARAQVMACARQYFASEFFNRLDALILFQPLSKAHMRDIIKLQVQVIVRRLVQATGGFGSATPSQHKGSVSAADTADSTDGGIALNVQQSAPDFI